jgi:hypothetical protein
MIERPHPSMRQGHQSIGLADRFIGAGLSVLVTLPTGGLVWLWVNRELAGSDSYIGTQTLALVIAAGAALAFLFPRLFPAVIGRLWDILLQLARW